MNECPKLIWKCQHTEAVDFINTHEADPTANYLLNIANKISYEWIKRVLPNTIVLEYESLGTDSMIHIYKIRPNGYKYEHYKKLINPNWVDMVNEFRDCNVCYSTELDERYIKRYWDIKKQEFYTFIDKLNGGAIRGTSI